MTDTRPTVGSLFSGIGGFDLGLERAGWRVAWQVENNPFRKKILRRHWPEVELRDDIVTDTDGLPGVDLICGGFPCQDVSVAGKRAGLAGERSGLFFEFTRLLRTLAPRWTLIENVPGLLSSNGGRDFAIVVSTLADLGYWWTYRVLDSRYFGVAQRRRRVYVVGHLGGPCPVEILFEPESLRGDPAPVGAERSEVAGTIGGQLEKRSYAPDGNGAFIANTLGGGGRRGWSNDPSFGNFIPERAGTVTGAEAHNGNSNPIPDNYVVNARQDPITGLPSLDRHGHSHAVAVEETAYALRSGRGRLSDSNGTTGNIVLAPTIMSSGAGTERPGGPRLAKEDEYCVLSTPPDADGVRKAPGLPGRLDATPDSPRYAALGDAVTVSVAEWIGRRILETHNE